MIRRVVVLAVVSSTCIVALSRVSGTDSLAAQGSTGSPTRKSTAASKPAAAKPWPPRTADGQPDISGVWGSAETGIYSLNLESLTHLRSIGMPQAARGQSSQGGPQTAPAPGIIAYAKGHTIVVDPPSGIIPYQPWALERRNAVMKGYLAPRPWQYDTQTPGWPTGVPRENIYSTVDSSVGGPIQIIQPKGHVVFLYETHHEFRVVPLDGRPQPGKDIKMWEGSSRGRWEGNTLVIDVTNNNDLPRLSVVGDFHSDEMRATERWTFTDKDKLQYRVTIDDPKVFTQPWSLGVTFDRAPAGTALLEYAGVEGDKSVANAQAIRKSLDDQGRK